MKMEKDATSIYQVAEFSGVSPGTVSRVINSDPRISKATVARVKEAIIALNYVPRAPSRRPGPRRNKVNSSRAIPIAVIATKAQAALNSPVYTSVFSGLEAGAAEANVKLVYRHLDSTNKKIPSETLGAIILGGYPRDKIPSDFRCVRIMAQRIPDLNHDWVSYDDTMVGRIAFNYLLSQNCKHMIMVSNQSSNSVFERVAVFKSACANKGITLTVLEKRLFVLHQNHQFVSTEEMQHLAPLLRQAPKSPIGLYLTHDAFAPLSYQIIRSCDMEPGREIKVVSVNNEKTFLETLDPKHASIDVHAYHIGKKAVEQLLWRIKNPNYPRVVIRFSPTLDA